MFERLILWACVLIAFGVLDAKNIHKKDLSAIRRHENRRDSDSDDVLHVIETLVNPVPSHIAQNTCWNWEGYTRCPSPELDRCIPSSFFCDGDNDCGDNSDEPEDCGSRICPEGSLRCASGQCIDESSFCNFGAQCADHTTFEDITCPEPAKSEWPELLGEDADKAAAVVKSDRPDIEVGIVRPDSNGMIAITHDWRSHRVRIFANADGVVFAVPSIG